VNCGTESTPGARAQEAARLISLFLGDLCVVAMASEDRRSFGPFAVDSRNEQMTAMMRQAIDDAPRERGAWPLAGRALISRDAVVIDRIRPGELEASSTRRWTATSGASGSVRSRSWRCAASTARQA
jgi:hypothetical protein